jgi:hypothetical protein
MYKLFLPILFTGLILFGFTSISYAQGNAFALRSSKWDTDTIEVTWINPTAADTQEREWVRQAIANSWQLAADITFSNWGKTTPSSRGIRIKISDQTPAVTKLGKRLNEEGEMMILNFTFNKWSPEMKSRRKDYIIATAVHEFGHALGFAHEHNRKDCHFCDIEPQGTTGDYFITTCDLNSVMNYCNPEYAGWGKLSHGDITAVTTLYGKRKIKPGDHPDRSSLALTHISRELTQEEKTSRPTLKRFIQIYLSGDRKAIDDVVSVTYALHPTFTQRYHRMTNDDSNFGFGIYVWGMFEIEASVLFRDGSTKELKRFLSFDKQ